MIATERLRGLLALGSAGLLATTAVGVAVWTSTADSGTTSKVISTAPPSPTSPSVAVDGPDGSWPGPDSTGVPAGTQLTRSGPLVISTPGVVVEGRDIHGDVLILADDVTIRASRITGGVIRIGDEATSPRGVVLADIELDGSGRADAARLAGIGYSGVTVLRANIHHVGVGVAAVEDVVVRDSWIHDLVVEGDPAAGGSHNEPILSNGGTRLTFVGNRLEAGTQKNMSAALALYGDFAPIEDVEVRGNLLVGGGYALYAGSLPDKKHPRASQVHVIGNVFYRSDSLQGGVFGPVSGWAGGPGHQWSRNRWSDDGSAVPEPASGT